MTSEGVLQAVRAWIKARLTLPDARVRVGPSNGVVSSTAYLTVQVASSRELSSTEWTATYAGGNATRSPRSTREWTVQVDGFGPGSRAMLDTLALWALIVDGPGLTLRNAGVHPARVGPVLQVPSLLTSAYVERARLDLTCYADLDGTSYATPTAADLVLDSEGRTPTLSGPTLDLDLEPTP